MAEVLYNVAAGLILSLSSSAVNEIGLWWGVSDELDKLRRTVGTIEAVLLHAEEQSINNPQLKHWLEMLSEALYDADDLLDDFSTEALRQQVMTGSEVLKKVRHFFSCSNQFGFGLKMSHKVNALRKRLDEIASEKNKFHLEERSVAGRSFVYNRRDQTHSSPPEVVIGREQEKEAIVELLLSADCEEKVSVIPIVGIGGLGKTTLAQLVYNDDRVNNHFELKMWVCVSDDFDVKLLVKNVLESASGKATENTQMDVLKNRLHEKINGRTYLLVLDDVWNEDVNKWLSFKDLLAGGARGSKIVITTRLRKIAEMSRPIFIHDLRGLSEIESWSLFKQMAFKQQQPPNPSLEAIGREIVAKCCGIPLAIKAIGGTLYFNDTESKWLLFKDKEFSTIHVYKNGILPILKLSYDHLPSHYKHCFSYCSLYPKDFKIRVEELVQLWKAQGYLKPTNSDECLRDVGFEYFMDLFQMSFFQDVEMDGFGNVEYCKMHDLMHDLAVSVAGDNFYASHSRSVSIQNQTLHMSFQVNKISLSEYMPSLLKAKKLRTVLALGSEINVEQYDVAFCNLRCLRVLGLTHMGNIPLPDSIYKLKHLRYLDLSRNDSVRKLPNSVCRLLNLQVLKLQSSINLMQLPRHITKLVNLTDLDNYECEKLRYMPRGIGKLTRLEKLSEFVVAKNQCFFKHSGGLDELHSLNNLRGKLKIRNLSYVKNGASEYEAANLSAKEQLQGLTLYWVSYSDDIKELDSNQNDVAHEEMGMEALCPHRNLKKLQVWYYSGVKPPSWLPSLTNLVSVCLLQCRNIKWLPPFDQLPHLKMLYIYCLTKLENIDLESGGSSSIFPSLTDLILADCPNLKGFDRLSKEEVPCFPCLSYLSIKGCPNLTCLPLFPKLKILKLDGDGMKSLMEILEMPTTFSATQSTSSPFSTLSQLKHLEIRCMEDSLENELLQYLPSLQHLVFDCCPLKSVCSDEKDDEMHWQSLKVLRTVEFHCMRNLVGLPKGLQYVATLQRLHINGCPELACIPEWMPQLTALQDLNISACRLLEERCKDNTAEDWPKIRQIPNVKFD